MVLLHIQCRGNSVAFSIISYYYSIDSKLVYRFRVGCFFLTEEKIQIEERSNIYKKMIPWKSYSIKSFSLRLLHICGRGLESRVYAQEIIHSDVVSRDQAMVGKITTADMFLN